MEEPTRFKKDSMKNTKIPYRLVIKRYWPSLLAISVTWFIYDFIAYPVSSITNLSLYPFANEVILSLVCTLQPLLTVSLDRRIRSTSSLDGTSLSSVFWSSVRLLLLTKPLPTSLFYMPGTIAGSFLVDVLGPRNTMVHFPIASPSGPILISFLLDRRTPLPSSLRLHYERSVWNVSHSTKLSSTSPLTHCFPSIALSKTSAHSLSVHLDTSLYFPLT